MAKKMKGGATSNLAKGNRQEFKPQDNFSGKDIKKENKNKKDNAGKEPAHSWDV